MREPRPPIADTLTVHAGQYYRVSLHQIDTGAYETGVVTRYPDNELHVFYTSPVFDVDRARLIFWRYAAAERDWEQRIKWSRQ